MNEMQSQETATSLSCSTFYLDMAADEHVQKLNVEFDGSSSTDYGLRKFYLQTSLNRSAFFGVPHKTKQNATVGFSEHSVESETSFFEEEEFGFDNESNRLVGFFGRKTNSSIKAIGFVTLDSLNDVSCN